MGHPRQRERGARAAALTRRRQVGPAGRAGEARAVRAKQTAWAEGGGRGVRATRAVAGLGWAGWRAGPRTGGRGRQCAGWAEREGSGPG